MGKLQTQTVVNTSFRRFPTFIFLLTLALALSVRAHAQSSPAKQDWIQLFNGKDLTGWDTKIAGYPLNDNVGNTFRVENGMLRIAYDQYKRFDKKYGHLYYQKPYSHYILNSSTGSRVIRCRGAIHGMFATAEL